jgi:hypothetical protein
MDGASQIRRIAVKVQVHANIQETQYSEFERNLNLLGHLYQVAMMPN